MSDPKTVLVTGSAGRVGQAAVQGLLERGHLVRGFDRAPSPELPEATVADLSDLEALKAALDGVRLDHDEGVFNRHTADNGIQPRLLGEVTPGGGLSPRRRGTTNR